jgi:Ser/Thr protein kinase RdoA (MazF antagonist)
VSSSELPFVTAASSAAAEWGLPAPTLLRLGMNGIFAAGDEVVLRVGRADGSAEGSIRLAGELLAAGIRVPAPRCSLPFRAGGLEVVAVERIHPTSPVDWVAVGDMVGRVHRLDPARLGALPWCGDFPWWQFDALLAEMEPDIDAAAFDGLRAAVANHLPLLTTARSGQRVVCHGDVHPGNVIQSAGGPVLLDWDLLCLGPPAWDHAPLMTWSERWGGEPGLYEAFARGIGGSLRGDPLAEAIALLRLVAATALRVRAGRDDPAAAVEAGHRLRWWRGEPDAPAWRAM